MLKANSLFLLLFTLLFELAFSLQTQAQEATINVHAENQKLSTVLENISKEYSTKFAFDADYFSGIRSNINYTNISINEFLKQLGQQHLFSYSLIDGTYVLFAVSPPATEVLETKKYLKISGRVSDGFSNEALMYCHVLFDPLKGAYTNELGHFQFEIPASDSIQVMISHLGYHRMDTTLQLSETNFFEFKLKPFELALAEIRVLSHEKNILELSTSADVIAFNPTQTSNIPRVDEGDMVNSLTLIPGVNFQAGQNSGLSIRGSAPSDNLVLIDGIPVLETNHLFGYMSALNSRFVKQAFVSRGGFDVTHGGRVSGIVELTGKTGSQQKINTDVSANLINGNSFLSIPLGKKISLSGAYRQSFIDQWQNYLFDKLQNISSDEDNDELNVIPTINYRDANAKLVLRPNKNQEINLNFMMTDETQVKDFVFNNDLMFRTEDSNGDNMGSSFNWSIQTGNWFNNFSAYYTDLNRMSYNESGKLSNSNQGNGKGKGKGIDNNKSTKIEMDSDSNSVQEQAASWQSEFKHGKFHHQLGAGYTVSEISYTFEAQQTKGNLPVDSISDNRTAEILHAYYQQQYSFSEKLKIRAGIRCNYQADKQQLFWQPRGGLYFNPTETLQFYYLTGKYIQFLSRIKRIDTFGNSDLAWYLPDASGQGILSSVHHVLGTRYEKGGLLLNAEIYHKNTDGKVNLFAEVYKRGPETRISYNAYSGDQKSTGIDIFAQYRTGGWSQIIAYTLSTSEERYENYNSGNYFFSFDDQRHRLRLVEMYKYNSWVLSASWIFNTGSPFQVSSGNDQVQFNRFKNFSQVDVSLVKRFKLKSFSLDAGATVLNVLNRQNIVGTDYLQFTDNESSTTLKSNTNSMSLTPVFT